MTNRNTQNATFVKDFYDMNSVNPNDYIKFLDEANDYLKNVIESDKDSFKNLYYSKGIEANNYLIDILNNNTNVNYGLASVNKSYIIEAIRKNLNKGEANFTDIDTSMNFSFICTQLQTIYKTLTNSSYEILDKMYNDHDKFMVCHVMDASNFRLTEDEIKEREASIFKTGLKCYGSSGRLNTLSATSFGTYNPNTTFLDIAFRTNEIIIQIPYSDDNYWLSDFDTVSENNCSYINPQYVQGSLTNGIFKNNPISLEDRKTYKFAFKERQLSEGISLSYNTDKNNITL